MTEGINFKIREPVPMIDGNRLTCTFTYLP